VEVQVLFRAQKKKQLASFLIYYTSMDITHYLVVLSAFISITGAAFYIRDTLSGKTKPNRVSWMMWSFAPLLGTVAALSAGADLWATVRVFLAGFLPLIVLVASFFNTKSYWKLTGFDFACGFLSLVGICLWVLIQSPQAAILFAAIGDGFAALPTLRKAWISPQTETGITYLASFVSVILVLPSIPVWNIENAAFSIFLLVQSGLLLFVVYRKKMFA